MLHKVFAKAIESTQLNRITQFINDLIEGHSGIDKIDRTGARPPRGR